MKKHRLYPGLLFYFFFFLFAVFIFAKFSLKMFGNIDLMISQYFFLAKSMSGIYLFYFFSFFGKASVVYLFTAIIAHFYKKKKEHIYVLALLFSVIFGSAISTLLKYLYLEPRPVLAVYREISYSFPSFHATIAVCFYGFLAWWIYKEVPNKILKYLLISSCIILIIGIGLSRVYLNVHFFSDVVGGYLLGITLLVGSINLYHYFQKK